MNKIRRPHNIPRYLLIFGMINYFYILLPCISPVWSQTSNPSLNNATQEIEIQVYTEGPSPKPIKTTVPFTWSIVIRWYGGSEILSPTLRKSPVFENLTVLQPSTTLRTKTENNRFYTEKIFQYKLIANSEGQAHIGSAVIAYSVDEDNERNVLSTEPVDILVEKAPFDWSAFFKQGLLNYYALTTLILILIIAGIVFFVIHRSRQEQEDEIKVQSDPYEETFNTAYKYRVEGKTHDYIRTLEKIVKMYLDEQNPDGKRETLAGYEENIENEKQHLFHRFLKECEQTKYSPGSPSPDILDRIWDDTKRLINRK